MKTKNNSGITVIELTAIIAGVLVAFGIIFLNHALSIGKKEMSVAESTNSTPVLQWTVSRNIASFVRQFEDGRLVPLLDPVGGAVATNDVFDKALALGVKHKASIVSFQLVDGYFYKSGRWEGVPIGRMSEDRPAIPNAVFPATAVVVYDKLVE